MRLEGRLVVVEKTAKKASQKTAKRAPGETVTPRGAPGKQRQRRGSKRSRLSVMLPDRLMELIRMRCDADDITMTAATIDAFKDWLAK